MGGAELYTFGEFTLDPAERRLSNAGRCLPLAPKTLEVLVAIVRNAGHLVTKSELLAQIWPDSFVEEGILAVHVAALRKTLGETRPGRRFIETIPRSGYRFIAAVARNEAFREAGAGRWSLAVLPTLPFTHEVFSGRDWPIGLTLADALVERLGRFGQILVRPIRAVHSYSPSGGDPASVGRALLVDAVLESVCARSAGRTKVSARLVRSRDGAWLWRSEFNEPGTGILAIADAVAGSVAAYLGCKSPEHGQYTTRPSLAPEVYEWFGRGRSHMLSASMFEVPKAIEAFRKAATQAPHYAAAHAGLALAHCAQAEYRLRPPGEAFSNARDAALRALAMDDSCADAQVALGAVLFLSDWNWIGAQRSLERALMMHPNHTEAYLLMGRLLEALGRREEGIEMKLRALERDPFSPLVHLQISMSYFCQRRYVESIEWANKTLELAPRHPHAREHLAGAFWKMGDFDRYMAANIAHAEMHGVTADALEPLRHAYAAGGVAGVGRFMLERAARQPQAIPDMQLAILHGEAGDLDSAFRHLDRALDSRDPSLAHLAVGPQWDSLRADPVRFSQRLERMGLAHVAQG